MNNKNTKASPCEAAWIEYRRSGVDIDSKCITGHQLLFSAGFRAGEEGKAELLEALEHMQTCRHCGEDAWADCEGGRKALAAIAKHTAKGDGQ